MKLINLQNLKNGSSLENFNINKKKENNTIEYVEKLNMKCESKVIKNPSKKFSLYKSNPEKQFIFSLLSELNTLEELFISNFIKEMKRKTENEIRKFFPMKKKEYEDRIKLILLKAEKELINNREILDNLKQKNLNLKNNLIMLKNQNRITNEELKESEISMKKLKEKYELYTQLKEIYDHFTYRFNYQLIAGNEKNSPGLNEEFKMNKKLLNEVEGELKEKKEQISQLKQKINNEEIHNLNTNYKLYNEFFDLERNYKKIEDNNKEKLLNIQQNINSNNLFVMENEKIQKSFISIFNLFYEGLNLERNLIKNPKNINLIKSDYTPRIFIIEELVNYIYLMLQNSTDESCFDLLKDIMSYINMFLREAGVDYYKIKYDPVLVVNIIEKNLNLYQNENDDLTENIKKIEKKIIQEKEFIRKLNNQIQKIKHISDELQISLKLSQFNNQENKNIRKSFSANTLKMQKNIKNIKKSKTNAEFENLNKKLETQIKEEKSPFFKVNLDNLINRINRLYFYRMNYKKYNEKSFDRYSSIMKRMNRKLNKLNKLKKNNQNCFSVESTITSNINKNIDNLILNIKKKLED